MKLAPYKLLIFLLMLLGVVFSYWYFDVGSLLSLQDVQARQGELRQWVSDRPVLTTIVFALVYYVAVAASLPFAALLSLLAGFLFGAVIGTLVVVVVATLGASTIFIAARFLVGQEVRARWHGKSVRLIERIEAKPIGGLLFLRLVPLFPFFIVNIAPAFTKIPVRTFVWTTLVGIVPGSFAYVYAGQGLGELAAGESILSRGVIDALLILGLMALVPSLWQWTRDYRAKLQSTEKSD